MNNTILNRSIDLRMNYSGEGCTLWPKNDEKPDFEATPLWRGGGALWPKNDEKPNFEATTLSCGWQMDLRMNYSGEGGTLWTKNDEKPNVETTNLSCGWQMDL